MDNEHIYPYWNNIFPGRTSDVSYDWNDPRWVDELAEPIDSNVWNQLVLLEQSGTSTNAAACGRFYEHILSLRPNFFGMIEGAPYDGYMRREHVPHHFNFYAQTNWMTQHLDGIPWELKKRRVSTNQVYYNRQNIAALMHLGGGWLIAATVFNDVPNTIIYKRMWCAPDPRLITTDRTEIRPGLRDLKPVSYV